MDVADPVPLGRQILASAGLDPRGGFSLFAILASGDFEDLRLDEPFDLRTRAAERFVAFQTDRDFKLTLDDDQLAWGKPAISGAALYTLAKVGNGQAVFLEVRGGEDRLISPQDLIDLTAPGIERFITGPMPARTFEIIVNARPRVVNDKRVTFEQVVQLAFPGSHEPNAAFSMTYRHAASKPHAGELGAGGSVEVKERGTIFNVTKTVQS
ncbi:multiubiquitin domain-containing protein [Myxococcus sp. QH3KD-4-1]|nr:multiubiquitin domain-containing protein [Myxococcus qinghaiensis]